MCLKNYLIVFIFTFCDKLMYFIRCLLLVPRHITVTSSEKLEFCGPKWHYKQWGIIEEENVSEEPFFWIIDKGFEFLRTVSIILSEIYLILIRTRAVSMTKRCWNCLRRSTMIWQKRVFARYFIIKARFLNPKIIAKKKMFFWVSAFA